MEITDTTYVDRVWLVEWHGLGNVMATLYREGEGPWRVEIRSRMFKDDRAFNSADTRHWSEWVAPDDSEASRRHGLAKIETALALIARGPFGTPHVWDRVDVQGGPEAFIKAISGKPWANLREAQAGGPEGEG